MKIIKRIIVYIFLILITFLNRVYALSDIQRSYLINADLFFPNEVADIMWLLEDIDFKKISEEEEKDIKELTKNYKKCLEKVRDNANLKIESPNEYKQIVSKIEDNDNNKGDNNQSENDNNGEGGNSSLGDAGLLQLEIYLENPELLKNESEIVSSAKYQYFLDATQKEINSEEKIDAYIECLNMISQNTVLKGTPNAKNIYKELVSKIEKVEKSWGLTVNQKEKLKNVKKSMDESAKQNQQNDELANPESEIKKDSPIYKYPDNLSKHNNAEESLEDVITDADNFVNNGELKINTTTLSNFSKTMYNILLAVGVVVAVIMGGIIGIKLMTGSIEEQVKAKQLLVPYVVGCIIVFGGFGIWKLVVTVLSGL